MTSETKIEADETWNRGETLTDDAIDALAIRVQAMGNLGNALRQQGRYEEAEPWLRRALAEAKQAFGPAASEDVSLPDNLDMLHQDQEPLDEAETHYRRTLSLLECDIRTCRRNLDWLKTKIAAWRRFLREYRVRHVVRQRAR